MASSKVVMGLQWGDEGKGKIIDILASRADVVVRSQGGDNAGHTVEVGKEVYKLHLVPSGILYPKTACYIGCGVVVNPGSLLKELDGLSARGIDCSALKIDPRAHVVMPWHPILDGLSEERRGLRDIGTTRRGIGPCYMDKAERVGIRMYDLVHPEILKQKVLEVGRFKNEIFVQVYHQEPLNLEAILEEYLPYGERLKSRIADVSVLTDRALREGKQVLFEGAQGSLLDLDTGTYPFVTSSHPVAGGVCTGTGIGPTAIGEVIGVGKAYTTRVGKGPFPTELLDETGNSIRQKGFEFGTTTGRPRRIGWFDAVLVRHGVRINGLTGLAINKLDTLSDLGKVEVCVAYRKPDGTVTEDFPPTLEELEGCTPIYETHPGFSGDLSLCRRYEDLPKACQQYIEMLETLCGCPITMVGVGPGREQNLER